MKNIKYSQTLRTALISITCIALIAIGQSTFAASLQNASSSVTLYGTFEAVVNAPEATGNKFALFPSFTFSKGSKLFKVDAFFNGNGNGNPSGSNWETRFMPDETGTWNYTWSFLGSTGSGSFNVGNKSNTKNFGHVKRAGKYLKHDDGTTFFYRGSNWASTAELRPVRNDNFPVAAETIYMTNSDWSALANRLAETGHNGHWIYNMDGLMNNDRTTFNLAWLKRIDFAVEKNANQGLYTFLEFFNAFGRIATNPYQWTLNGKDQLLDPWNRNRYMQAKELFIRYIIARYSGHYNVMWSLGNEMEHSPNSGSAFVNVANSHYIPWIRSYDPYDLPITLSENIWKSTNIDIGGNHQQQSVSVGEKFPIINTELVRSNGASDVMWKGATIRKPSNRKFYRAIMWKNLVEGGSGSVEATGLFWLDGTGGFPNVASMLSDKNVRNIMEDHGRLAKFIDDLDNELSDLGPLGSSALGSANLSYSARGQQGNEYLAYFSGEVKNGVNITLKLPAGSFSAKWFSPTTGQYTSETQVSNRTAITSPWKQEEDVALYITKSVNGDPSPSAPTLESVN